MADASVRRISRHAERLDREDVPGSPGPQPGEPRGCGFEISHKPGHQGSPGGSGLVGDKIRAGAEAPATSRGSAEDHGAGIYVQSRPDLCHALQGQRSTAGCGEAGGTDGIVM